MENKDFFEATSSILYATCTSFFKFNGIFQILQFICNSIGIIIFLFPKTSENLLVNNTFSVYNYFMAISVNLGTILRQYAKKQESVFINFREFCDYVKKYASHHLEEQPDLVQYLEIPDSTLLKELEDYQNKHEVYLIQQNNGKITIACLTAYSVYYANKYKEIISNPQIPFPCANDLPKQLPADALEKKSLEDVVQEWQVKQNTKSPKLYCVLMPRDIPSLLIPECVPINFVTRDAMAKIRNMLKKDEYHDYFQKKVRVANPSKEIAAQAFFTKFLQHPDTSDQTFDFSGDAFYFWNQLCYFIRLDFEKIKDRTTEDTNVLQAVAVSEVWMMTLKEKASKQQTKENALNELRAALARPPYFFSMESILKLKDSKGALLYGQYDEDDLKEFLQKITTECENNELPQVLVFKIETGARYFIYKNKVFQLVIRLANEAHDTIEKHLTDKWFKILSNYEKLPEMKSEKDFENCLKKEIHDLSPVLYALLNANFLTMLNYETSHANSEPAFHIFSGGKLLPYSELLMLKNSAILANAKNMLPFWYTIPVISWLASLFSKKKRKPAQSKIAQKEFTADDIPDDEEIQKPAKFASKKDAIQAAAKNIAEELVPSGSTIDRELDSYGKIWNKMITKEAHNSLSEDVNCLIRDYTRKVMRTISAQTFDENRLRSLAEGLVKTPNMQKIKEEEALTIYVELYMLRLLSNG